MNEVSIITFTDGYKISHRNQYPPGTTEIYSYFESRGGQFDDIVFYGLQYYIKKYLAGVVITEEKIKKAEKLLTKYLPNNVFDSSVWYRLIEKHGGKLPIEIKAVPEGTVVPVRNVLMTVRNTDPEFFWLTNYIETILSQIWYPCTVATYSREIKKEIKKYLFSTGCTDIDSEIMFKLNDFGVRGSTSYESSLIGGSAHLINFSGTDNISSIEFIQDYYNTDDIYGYSLPASEHSTITAWGKENELEAYRNLLKQYPTGMVACVSDSYDIYNACWELWGTKLHDEIMGRDGILIIRPDSGDPSTVILKVINILGDRFGYTVNELGYKVLDPHIRIIQGDGVNYDSIVEILKMLKSNKWAAENLAFGSGGALLQKHDRDTQKFAFKCSNAIVNGVDVDVYKNPITDPGKISKKGKMKLVKVGHSFDTVADWFTTTDVLQTVFLNGDIYNEITFDEIRLNAAI